MFSCEDSAEKKFWRTPELVESLLPFFDLESTKQMAAIHPLTLKLLGNAHIFKKLIKRTFHEEDKHRLEELPVDETDSVLVSEMSKAAGLADILSLIGGGGGQVADLEKDLLHTLCKKFPSTEDCKENSVLLSCSCLQIHPVSLQGFVLIETVEAKLKSVQQVVKVVLHGNTLMEESILAALGSRVLRQLEKVIALETFMRREEALEICCKNKELSEAWASLLEHTGQLVVPRVLQSIEGEIGEEGWSAIRRAVEHLSEAGVGQISVRTRRTAMRAARRDDLKAIWEIACFWAVSSEMGDQADVVFKEDKDGDGEPALMSQIIEMTEEEWAEERRENWEEDSGEDADEDSESE